MIVTTVAVRVIPGHEDDFIAATRRNHEGSVQEAGCVRFDVLRVRDVPHAFLIYEVYESEEAAAAHKSTAHYLAWRDAVAPWMAEPRKGVAHIPLAPMRREDW